MSISLTCTLTALISKQAVDYWNMDTASEFHLIMCWKKEKSCICLFFAETRDEERLKTPFPDNSEKSERTSWQDLTKPIAERENFKQNQNLQTMKEGCKHITSGSVSLPARLHLSVSIPDCVSICLTFHSTCFTKKKVSSILHHCCCCSDCSQLLFSCCKLQLSCHVVIKNLLLIQLLHATQETLQFPHLYCVLHNKARISLNSALMLVQM